MNAEWTVAAGEAGLTLAAFVRGRLAEARGEAPSWSTVRGWCARGKLQVDGRLALDAALRLRGKQKVTFDAHARPPKPESAATIVFEDAHVVVIDKPSGISSVPYEKREGDTAMDAIRAAWRHAGRRATATPLYVVHRIDKETSGLIAFAKTKLAERELQALFRAHEVARSYLVVAHGQVWDKRIESRLVSDRGDGLRGSTRTPGQGKRAVTHVHVLERLPRASLLAVRLETGKTHQIRIHLSEHGHPIVGERVYIRDYLRHENTPLPSPRLLLHAATLGFAHPVSGAPVALEAPLPDDFQAALARLRSE